MTIYHVHGEPVWRARADSVIQAHIQFEGEQYLEQLWARRVDDDIFEICCIPVFLYNLALGDHVEAPEHILQRVVTRSGRYTFRVRFDLERCQRVRDEVIRHLQERGYLFEWHSPALLAIDAASAESAQALADLLVEREGRGELVHETGLERPPEELGTNAEFSRMRSREDRSSSNDGLT